MREPSALLRFINDRFTPAGGRIWRYLGEMSKKHSLPIITLGL